MVTPKFSEPKLAVHSILRRRVNEYFQEIKISPQGNWELYIKASFLLFSFISIYLHLIFFKPFLYVAILECLLLGILTALIGFNVMHDGAHGSFSKHSLINGFASLTLDFLGASSFLWSIKHNIIHHSFTNIDGIDDDIDAKPFLRLCCSQKYYKIHRYQYIYVWLLYLLLYLFWVFYRDYKKYFILRIGNIHLKKFSFREHAFFWIFKILYVCMYIALPIYFWGFNCWIIGFLIYAACAGFLLSVVFQLAHTVDETSFPAISKSNRIEDEWALHQLKSTANFSTKNRFITWWLGGLNFQIEHHLFPKISHIHYPALSKIVKETCNEIGIPYIEHHSIYLAIKSHMGYLKKLGLKN